MCLREEELQPIELTPADKDMNSLVSLIRKNLLKVLRVPAKYFGVKDEGLRTKGIARGPRDGLRSPTRDPR